MRKTILSIAIVILSSTGILHAQQRPVAGARSFTFGVNGLDFLSFNTNASRTGSLLFRQYITDNKAIRAAANFSINASNGSLEDTSAGFKQSFSNMQMAITISGGLQKSLGTQSRLEPYIGIDGVIGTGSGKNTSRQEITNGDKTPQFNDKTGDYQESTITNSTPFTFGAIPLIGFNYYLAEGIALGGEFGYGFNMAFSSPTKRITSSRVNGTDVPKQESNISPRTNNISLQNTGITNITLSIYF